MAMGSASHTKGRQLDFGKVYTLIAALKWKSTIAVGAILVPGGIVLRKIFRWYIPFPVKLMCLAEAMNLGILMHSPFCEKIDPDFT